MGSRGERGVAGAKEQIVAFLYIIIMRLCQFMMEGVGPRLDMLVHSQLVKPQISIIIEKKGERAMIAAETVAARSEPL
jgi:hypothetical protein